MAALTAAVSQPSRTCLRGCTQRRSNAPAMAYKPTDIDMHDRGSLTLGRSGSVITIGLLKSRDAAVRPKLRCSRRNNAPELRY